MEPRRDIIVAGGGLSGLSAALIAKAGDLDAAVIEKFSQPDDKRYIDELAYPHTLRSILADYAEYDSLVYPIGRRAFWIMSGESHTAMETVSLSGINPKAGYVIDRLKLDIALRERFLKLGGEIIDGVEISELVHDDSGCTAGVQIANEEVYESSLVIIATGSESHLAEKKLHAETSDKRDKVLILKETLHGENNEPAMRLTGTADYAASIIILGDPVEVGFSWARVIAAANTLHIKIYIPLELTGSNHNPQIYMEKLKAHPSLEPVVRGLESMLFTKQIVRSGGFVEFPGQLWNEGYMLTGKAAGLYHPFDCRMTDYSIASGVIAGKAAVNANFDRRLARPHEYPAMLADSFLIPDRNSMRDFMEFLKSNSKFSGVYPDVMLRIIEGVFTMDSRSKQQKKKELEREIRSKCAMWDLVSDFGKLLKLYG